MVSIYHNVILLLSAEENFYVEVNFAAGRDNLGLDNKKKYD